MSIDLSQLLQAASQSKSPFAAPGLQAIANNDQQAGEQIANNILQSMGLTKEEGIAQAKKFFGMQN